MKTDATLDPKACLIQLIDPATGRRSGQMLCTPKELAAIVSKDERLEEINNQYVLIVMDQNKMHGEFETSDCPLMTVKTFCTHYGESL